MNVTSVRIGDIIQSIWIIQFPSRATVYTELSGGQGLILNDIFRKAIITLYKVNGIWQPIYALPQLSASFIEEINIFLIDGVAYLIQLSCCEEAYFTVCKYSFSTMWQQFYFLNEHTNYMEQLLKMETNFLLKLCKLAVKTFIIIMIM